MRRALIGMVVGVLLAGAAPAAPPEAPVSFIKVDELKELLDRGTKADIIDVRHWESTSRATSRARAPCRCAR